MLFPARNSFQQTVQCVWFLQGVGGKQLSNVKNWGDVPSRPPKIPTALGSSDRKRALCPCWNSLDRSSRFQIQVHIVSRQKQMCNSSDWHIQWSHIGVNFFLKKCFYSQYFPRRLRNVTTILLLPLIGINNFKGILYRDFENRQRNLLGKD